MNASLSIDPNLGHTVEHSGPAVLTHPGPWPTSPKEIST